MDKSRINILVVDDEPGICAGVQEALTREGYVVDGAGDAAGALRQMSERLYNVVLADVKMPGMSGLDLLKEAKEKSRDTVFILMTAYGTVETAVQAMKEGAYDYLSKPLDLRRLRALVMKALEFQAVMAENSELRMRLRAGNDSSLLVGDSEPMRAVSRLLQEVATSDVIPISILERGNLEVVEVKIRENSPALKVPVKALVLPPGRARCCGASGWPIGSAPQAKRPSGSPCRADRPSRPGRARGRRGNPRPGRRCCPPP